MTELTPGARPDELVPGNPGEVDRLAARLARFATSSGEAAARLDRIDERTWSGEAGRLFREAVGPVPARLSTAAGAFAAAARALTAYAGVLREGQATAARAVRLVEQSTPDSAEHDRQLAMSWLARARVQVEQAGEIAAMRLGEAAAEAPTESGEPAGRGLTGPGVTVRVVTEHELTDPDHYVSQPGEWGDTVADVRYTQPHEVGFADAGAAGSAHAAGPAEAGLPVPAETGEVAWQSWAGADSGRGLGVVEPGLLAALGVAALGLTVIGRRRRDSTAMGLADLDDAELRRRRDEFAGARDRDGVLAPATAGKLRSADAWRTRLASPPRAGGTVQHWTGPVGSPVRPVRVTGEPLGSVHREVRGAVLRTGRPAREA